MKLRDLEARFLKVESKKSFSEVDTLAEAQGIIFLCPKCFEAHQGKQGTHSVICWFKDRGVPEDLHPWPGRWIPAGTGIDDLTFVGPDAASVFLNGGGCQWHGFVKNGDAA